MTWMSLGSLALPHQLQRHSAQLRLDITRLGQELATGEVTSPQRHLRGQIGPLSTLSARLARIGAYSDAAHSASLQADAVQTSLGHLETLRSSTADRMLAAATAGNSGDALLNDGRAAMSAFSDAVSSLNANHAGIAIFAGNATDTSPLISARDMMDALLPSLSGLSRAQDVAAAIDAEFLQAGGLFETAFYQGGTAGAGILVDETRVVSSMPTANDPAIREVLASLIKAAVLGESALSLGEKEKANLARLSAEALFDASTASVTLQTKVGQTQETLELALARLSTERDGLDVARQTMVGADPYEAAVQLELAQTQLETIFAVTARTARLSLVEYL